MSDERLRDLERRWKETGDPQHGAALLRERVRVGELEDERLRLAALLGDPASIAARGEEEAAPPKLYSALESVLAFDLGFLPRVGHAMTTAVLSGQGIPDDALESVAIVSSVIRRLVRTPNIEVDWPAVGTWVLGPADGGSRTSAALNAIALVAAALADPSDRRHSEVEMAIGIGYADQAVGTTAVRARFSAELAPVLLQQRDPLVEIPDALTCDRFWSLIERSRASAGADGQLGALAHALRNLTPLELSDFWQHLDRQFERASRPDLWSACRLVLGGADEIQFRGFRLGLIALGQEWFESALVSPDTLAECPAFTPCEDLRRAVREVLSDAELPPWLTDDRSPGVDPAAVDEARLADSFPGLWARYEAPRVRA